MKEQLERIKSEALAKMEAADALERLNEIRVAYLGKKGELTGVLKSIKVIHLILKVLIITILFTKQYENMDMKILKLKF